MLRRLLGKSKIYPHDPIIDLAKISGVSGSRSSHSSSAAKTSSSGSSDSSKGNTLAPLLEIKEETSRSHVSSSKSDQSDNEANTQDTETLLQKAFFNTMGLPQKENEEADYDALDGNFERVVDAVNIFIKRNCVQNSATTLENKLDPGFYDDRSVDPVTFLFCLRAAIDSTKEVPVGAFVKMIVILNRYLKMCDAHLTFANANNLLAASLSLACGPEFPVELFASKEQLENLKAMHSCMLTKFGSEKIIITALEEKTALTQLDHAVAEQMRANKINSITLFLNRVCVSNGGLKAPIPADDKKRLHTLFYRKSEDTPIEFVLLRLVNCVETVLKKQVPIECFDNMLLILNRYIQKNTRLLYFNVNRLMVACLSLACESHGFSNEVFAKWSGIGLENLTTMRTAVLEKVGSIATLFKYHQGLSKVLATSDAEVKPQYVLYKGYPAADFAEQGGIQVRPRR